MSIYLFQHVRCKNTTKCSSDNNIPFISTFSILCPERKKSLDDLIDSSPIQGVNQRV